MRPSRLLAVVLLSAAILPPGAFARPKVPPKVPKDDVQSYTDLEFDTVESVAGNEAGHIEKAQQIFNRKLKETQTQTFPGKDVEDVGENVATLIDASKRYWDAINKAQTPEDVQHAGAQFTARLKQNGVSLPMLKAATAEIKATGKKLTNAMNADEGNGDGQKSIQAALMEGGAVSTGKGTGSADSANRELVHMAIAATHEALTADPKPKPKPDPGPSTGGGPVLPNPGGGNTSGGQSAHVPTTGDLLGINDPANPSDAMADARERYAHGDVSGAVGDATRAIDLGGGAQAYAMRGGMLYDQQQYGAANADARRALESDPRNSEARALLQFTEGRVQVAGGGGDRGAASSSAGRTAAGGSVGKEAAAAPSAGPTAAQRAAASRLSGEQAYRAAQNAMALHDVSGAMAYIDRALAADPNNPSLLHMRAGIYGRQHDWAKALADEKAALALSPKNAAMLRGKGYLELRGGQYKDALGSANAMIEANPNEAYGYAVRAQAYARLGDLDAYRADLRRAAELDPVYREAAAHPVTQAPSDSDLLFLFPGEDAAKPVAPAAAGRARQFSWVVAASIAGGILLALGLLQTVLSPVKEQVASVFTRLTRTGPTVGALGDEPAARGGAPGLIRGQYEITRPIGAGGMGMVYEGTDRSLGRRVAIKKMRDELRADARERARFVSEAKTVAALHHPGIVDIYAIADEGDEVYLIFEYVDGKTVHDLISAAGKLAPEQAVRIVGAAADALEFAHSRGVIHRDMKPSNMMVDAQGRVKVMDFGIARMAKEAMTRYSMTNTVVGTPPYMAPEQEQGQVRRESDVYALAVCAYEMLTGRLPFAGVGGGMSLNKINMSFVLPSRQEPGLPGAVDGVFARAFQADPEKRYRTPGEFAADLRAVLSAAARA